LRWLFLTATTGFSLNSGSNGSIFPLGLYIGGGIDDDLVFPAGVVDAIAFGSLPALSPDVEMLGARATEMSDLGFTGGLDFTVFPDLVADGADFLAISGCWGAGFPVSACLTAGLAFGLDFFCDCVLAGWAFWAVWVWIFFRTTLGEAGLSAGWSQPSITAIKPIKQAKLQMMVRCFFIMVKITLWADVKPCIRYQFIFSSFSFSFPFSYPSWTALEGPVL
jgi:hypothetical protein